MKEGSKNFVGKLFRSYSLWLIFFLLIILEFNVLAKSGPGELWGRTLGLFIIAIIIASVFVFIRSIYGNKKEN